VGNGKTWKSDRFLNPPSSLVAVPRCAHYSLVFRCQVRRLLSNWPHPGSLQTLSSDGACQTNSFPVNVFFLHASFYVSACLRRAAGAVFQAVFQCCTSCLQCTVRYLRLWVVALWVVESELGKEDPPAGTLSPDGSVQEWHFSQDPGKNGTPLSRLSNNPPQATQHFVSVIGLPTAAAAILPSPTHGPRARSAVPANSSLLTTSTPFPSPGATRPIESVPTGSAPTQDRPRPTPLCAALSPGLDA
jgi:hypothetical protein